MKKLIPVVVVLVIAVLGWVYLSGKKAANAPASKNDVIAPKNETVQESGIVSSIKEAMGLGRTMQCSYAVNESPATMATVYIEGQKFKMETQASGANMMVLSDGEKQYVWNNGTKQGFSISNTCLKELEKTLPKNDANEELQTNSGDFAATLDAAKNVQCQSASGIDFAVPKDVTFSDQCDMMKQSAQMMQRVKVKLPAGVNIPGY